MRTDIMIRMQAKSDKGQNSQNSKAMQIAAAIDGVESVTLSGEGRNLLRVVGEDLDSNDLITKLRKKLGHADIVQLRTLQAGRGYTTANDAARGGYQSATVGSYSPWPAAADQYYYYRHQQPSHEYCYSPLPLYPAAVVLHEYPAGDSTGCSIM